MVPTFIHFFISNSYLLTIPIRTIIIKSYIVHLKEEDKNENLKTNGVKKAKQVEPIKNKKDLMKLVTYLKATSLRNYTIVVVGMNVLLRAGDLLELRNGVMF